MGSGTGPVARSTMCFAHWFKSRGRFGCFSGMLAICDGIRADARPNQNVANETGPLPENYLFDACAFFRIVAVKSIRMPNCVRPPGSRRGGFHFQPSETGHELCPVRTLSARG